MRVGVFVFPLAFYVSFPWIFWTFKGSAKTLTKTYPKMEPEAIHPELSEGKSSEPTKPPWLGVQNCSFFGGVYRIYPQKSEFDWYDWYLTPSLFHKFGGGSIFGGSKIFKKKQTCCQRSATPVGWKNMGQSYTSKELPCPRSEAWGPITGGSPSQCPW